MKNLVKYKRNNYVDVRKGNEESVDVASLFTLYSTANLRFSSNFHAHHHKQNRARTLINKK